MSKVDDIIHAIDDEGASSWEIADELAALDELDEATGKPLTLEQVSKHIYSKRGVEWSPRTLGDYRKTAIAFPNALRSAPHSFQVYRELRAHPDKLLAWKPKKDGDVLTVERARALRGGGSSSAKQKPGAWKDKVDRALSKVVDESENDPVWTIDALNDAIAEVERRHRRKLVKARALRAVPA